MLPAWLGTGEALEQLATAGEHSVLEEMYRAWPFFAARLSMLEMVFAKTDAGLAAFYDEQLVDPALQPLQAFRALNLGDHRLRIDHQREGIDMARQGLHGRSPGECTGGLPVKTM